MYVSGFTIARNVVQADYPIKEALMSIAPLCDEIIVAVGKSDDSTLEYIKNIPLNTIKIIETEWDDNLREGGKVLAVETNKALEAINPKADWCIYIQADECAHEKDIEQLKKLMLKHKNNPKIDGILFDYRHFYGSYDYVAVSRGWYRKEIRIIKNNPNIRSYKDAQGFRKNNLSKKLNVIDSGSHIHHYGWVKHPSLQMQKQLQARKLWHTDKFIKKEVATAASFDYSEIDVLAKFKGTHPTVMQHRIDKINWEFDHDISKINLSLKNRLLYWFEKKYGFRLFENKNYKL